MGSDAWRSLALAVFGELLKFQRLKVLQMGTDLD
jgi:hypothetical protein